MTYSDTQANNVWVFLFTIAVSAMGWIMPFITTIEPLVTFSFILILCFPSLIFYTYKEGLYVIESWIFALSKSFIVGFCWVGSVGWVVFILGLHELVWRFLLLIQNVYFLFKLYSVIKNEAGNEAVPLGVADISPILGLIISALVLVCVFIIAPPFLIYDSSTHYYPPSLSMYESRDLVANYSINPLPIWQPPYLAFLISSLFMLQGYASFSSASYLMLFFSLFAFPIFYRFFDTVTCSSSRTKTVLALTTATSSPVLTYGYLLLTDILSLLMITMFIVYLVEFIQDWESNYYDILLILVNMFAIKITMGFAVIFLLVCVLLMTFYRKQTRQDSRNDYTHKGWIYRLLTLFLIVTISYGLISIQNIIVQSRYGLNVSDNLTQFLDSLANLALVNQIVFYVLSFDDVIGLPSNLLGVPILNVMVSITLVVILLIGFLLTLQRLWAMRRLQIENSNVHQKSQNGTIAILLFYLYSIPVISIHIIFWAQDYRYVIIYMPLIVYSLFTLTGVISNWFLQLLKEKREEKANPILCTLRRFFKIAPILVLLILITIPLVNQALMYRYQNVSNDPFRNAVLQMTSIEDIEKSLVLSNQPGSIYYYTGAKGVHLNLLNEAENATAEALHFLFYMNESKFYRAVGYVLFDDYIEVDPPRLGSFADFLESNAELLFHVTGNGHNAWLYRIQRP